MSKRLSWLKSRKSFILIASFLVMAKAKAFFVAIPFVYWAVAGLVTALTAVSVLWGNEASNQGKNGLTIESAIDNKFPTPNLNTQQILRDPELPTGIRYVHPDQPIAQNTITPDRNPGPSFTTYRTKEECNRAIESELQDKLLKAAQMAPPVMVSELVARFKVPLTQPSAPFNAVIASAKNNQDPYLVVNGVSIAKIEPVFDDFVTMTLSASMPKAAAEAAVKQLMSSGYFEMVEANAGRVQESAASKSYSESAEPLNLWHLAGPDSIRKTLSWKPSYSNSEDMAKYGALYAGANILNIWEKRLLGDPEKPSVIAVIEPDGVYRQPNSKMPDPLLGYNFAKDGDYVRDSISYKNNSYPDDVREKLKVATEKIRKERSSYYHCPHCSTNGSFDGRGPDGGDYDRYPVDTSVAKTMKEFLSGPWFGEESHGQTVASIISRFSNADAEAPGVSHNVHEKTELNKSESPRSNVKILPVKIGNGVADAVAIANAILWSAGVPLASALPNLDPARVLNLSFGILGKQTCPTVVQAAINKVIKEKNAVVVVSAGNDEVRKIVNVHSYPSNCENVIRVAASSPHAIPDLASYSNVFADTTIAAPGGGVVCVADDKGGSRIMPIGISVLAQRNGVARETEPILDYVIGTSYATPIMSGVIEMMLRVAPTLTTADIEKILRKTAYDFESNTQCGPGGLLVKICGSMGRLNAEAAVLSAYAFEAMQPRNVEPKCDLSSSLVQGQKRLLNASSSCAQPPTATTSPFAPVKGAPSAPPSPPKPTTPTTPTASQVAKEIGLMSAAQIGALQPAQLKALSADQVVKHYSALTWAHARSLSYAQLMKMPVPAMKQLLAMMTADELTSYGLSISGAQVTALPKEQLVGVWPPALVARHIGSMSRAQIGVLQPAQLTKLSADQVKKHYSPLSWSALASLNKNQTATLTAQQRAQIGLRK